MDQPHYDYSALPLRAEAPVAPFARQGLSAYVVLCLEHWDAEPVASAVRDPRFVGEFGSFSPDYRNWTQREYGLRIGVFRVIEALREAGIRPAIAANSRVLERLPALVRVFTDWGCEWIAHGHSASSLMHTGMSIDAQRSHIGDAVRCIHAHTGHRPLGWLSQDWGTTPDTYSLLAEAGLRYTLDWNNDDQPYRMRTDPTLLSVPLSSEWDDVQCQWLRNMTPAAHTELSLAAFDRLLRETSAPGRMATFGLALHPWVCGMSSRIAGLRALLDALRERKSARWIQPAQLLL